MMDRRSGSNNSYRDYVTVDMDTDDGDSEFEEKDPSGRYGRYKDILGRGAFKTVYKAFDELEGMEVAWNQIKIHDAMKGIEDLERLYSEVHLLKTLKHQNIIKFYNSWIDTTNDNVNFITEIFTSGTLRQYRKKHRNVDMRAVKNWSRQILRGLVYLHSHDPPIIHRDLKCDNIFVNGNQGQVKIGDLGLAAILRKTNAAHSVIGTPEFMAPELYEEEYNELVDVYSFGMCLLEMVTLEYPYSECANAAQIFKKVTAGIKPAALDQVKDPVVREFVEKCLASVSERLSANQLLVDPFLQCEGIECVPYSHINEVQYGFDKSFASEESSIEEATKVETCSKISSATLLEPSLKNEDSESFTEDEEFPWEKSNRDFAVKGHKKNENTAFLSLQIVDPEGHIRNIHFPFDITIDTAMTVAREMVTELDLSDEDVTNIATMIDAEMQELVPGWKPGVPQDNIVYEETNANYDVYEFENDVPKLFENSSSQKNGYKLERLPSGRHFWSDSPTKMFNTTKKKKNIDSSRKNLRHAKSEDMSFEFVFSSSDHQENNHHHQDTVNKLDIVKETPANQERSYMHGSTQVFRKSQSCSEIDRMSSDNMSFEDMQIGCSSHTDSEMPKHGSLLVEDLKEESHSQQSAFAQMLADMSINHLSVADIEICDGLLAYLQERFGQGVARKFENLVLKQQQELEGLKRRHERDLQNFMEELSHNGEDNGNNRQLNGLGLKKMSSSNLTNGCTSEMIKKGSYGESDNGSESTKLNGHHNTGSRAA